MENKNDFKKLKNQIKIIGNLEWIDSVMGINTINKT
jgi:hypothetical protein